MTGKRLGGGLVGMLVAAAIVLVAVVVFTTDPFHFSGAAPARADGKGTTVMGASIYKAKDATCQSNLQQLRMSLQANADPSEGAFPQSLEETRLGPEFLKCPVGGEPYVYDPQTGQVHCPHPGHERF